MSDDWYYKPFVHEEEATGHICMKCIVVEPSVLLEAPKIQPPLLSADDGQRRLTRDR